MLTLSFAWSQAQNTSSAKQLLTFGFTTAANSSAQLGSDVTGVINQTNRTVALTVPYQAVVTALKATFTSSPFSNVYIGVNPGTGTLATSGSTAADYTSPVTWTVEAENHSFDNYVVTVTKAAASTAKDLLTFSGAWAKPWSGPCTANGTVLQTEPGTFTGTTVTFPVPYGSNLDAITVYFTISPYATANHTTATAYDFDADNNGVPEARTLTVTAQDGTSTQSYSILPVVGVASEADALLAFAVPTTGSTVAINHTNQTITVTVPYSTASIAPTWSISPYAHMFSDAAYTTEICSGATLTLSTSPMTFNFYIRAEDPSEMSQYVMTVTKDAASTVNTLSAISASFSKTLCSTTTTGTLVGTIGASTVTFNVPYGVTSVLVTSFTKTSTLATTTLVANTTTLSNASTFTVTSESGAVKTYTVTLTPGAVSNAKQLLTFGFKASVNNPLFLATNQWATGSTYAGTIDQTTKRVAVTVPYNTDLHHMIAYFTQSDYACVSIAESNGSFTAQTTDVTQNDHSNTLTYVVTAEDGTQERYEVTVTKEAALTGNDLIGFKLTNLPYCFGGYFEAAGTYTGNNIAVSVKYGTSLSSLAYSFTVSAGATASIATSGTTSFASPVTVTVTSQSGATKTYTITVTARAENSDKKLLTYWFDADNNSGLGLDAVGTVNEAAKTVEVWIPWDYRANITSLKASFTLSTNALMTHSEDTQVLQVSGTSANDFTTPVAYTVWAENCTSVEYFVTVKVIPNTNTGISAFTFASSGCGCDLVNKIDSYARRIYITLPYTMNISSLAPSAVTVTPGATVTVANTNPVQSWSTAKDWTKGPVTYTVTAPDGVTKADWTVYVSNPACKEANITSWSFASGQVGSAHIDEDAHTVDITISAGTNLKNMTATIGLSCGATICCNMGACAGTTIDFSDNLCHTCVVTAQDQTVTQDWTICLHYADVTLPEVTTWSVMAYNCTDSVAVQSNELGYVFIVNESAINMNATPKPLSLYNLADMTSAATVAYSVADLVADRLGAYAAVTAANTPVYVKTNGLYSGTYWAFSVDAAGNISCISAQKLYLDICDVEVATLCDLRGQPMVWRYTLTEEIFVTYEETRGTGNWKFMQNASCGILVEDKLGALPTTYGEGAGIKGLRGMLDNSGVALKLIPVCCYLPTKNSTGNVVTPIEQTYAQFKANCYTGSHAYESMLVKITTPIIAFDDYHGHPNWMYDNLDLATTTAKGDYDWFIQSIFNSSLIGTAIPTAPAYYTGIRTNVNWSPIYGLITPRKAADITMVSGPILAYTPNPISIEGVLPGQCKSANVTIYNEGATLTVNNVTISGVANITALYLDDNTATDEFNIVTPPAVPFSINPWASQVVRVDFCPTNVGDESTNLIVEYGIGKTLVIPINGKTAVINAMPSCQNFNSPHPGGSDFGAAYNGWLHPEDNITYLQNYVSNAWVSYDGSAVMNMRPRKQVSGVRQTTWMTSPGFIVSGTDPVITWVEASSTNAWAGAKNSPRNLYVSTNGTTWTLVDSYSSATMPDAWIGEAWRTKTYSLASYVGQTIWWKWELQSVANEYTYWCLDNICVQERITTPIIVGAPNPGDFGGVQVGASSTLNFNIKNTGISVLKVKKVQVVGTGFTLTDTNTYPFEVTSSSGAWAYAIPNSGSQLNFAVNFNPTDIGVKTGKIVVTYGLYSDMTYEIPITGEGLSCYTAAVANKGDNWAPSQNTWFKYTADKFSIVQVTSCHPHQDLVTNEYAWDTYLYVYSDCEGTLIASHDDMEGACVYNRASSSVQTVLNQGETIYIFWPLAFPTALHAYEGFYFTINVTYPIDGDVCQNAIPLTLPVVNHFGTTVGFNDDYDQSPCSPFSNYMDGNDKVYSITLATEGYLVGNILGAYGSIHVLDICPEEELTKDHCKAFVGGPNGGQFRKKIAAGSYFVIISTWAPPQTVDYLLNMSFESSSAVENGDLTNTLSVYPNPTSGKFNVSISNAEATDMTLELVNISGQVVYRNEVKAAYSYNEEIDATQFAKGVYYLKVNNGKEVKIEKVVVE
jgi:hypothetical protein